MDDKQVQINLESWQWIISHYESLTHSWPDAKALFYVLRLCEHLARTDHAQHFYAGQSLWRLIIKPLDERQPGVIIKPPNDMTTGRSTWTQFEITYHGETQLCDLDELLVKAQAVLDRLWQDTISK